MTALLLSMGCSDPSADRSADPSTDRFIDTSTDTSTGGDGPHVISACNGHAELCDRSLPLVTLPGTHNSMSNDDAGWLIPNQQHGLSQQLADGVRAFMLDTYDVEGVPMLCHAYCELGSQPLDEGLTELNTFLDDHPDELISVIFEDYISPEETVAIAEQVGLAARAITPPQDGVWPTLRELIQADERVLMTAESGGGAADWYVGAWTLYFDTPYRFESADDFSCDLNRGSSDNPFFLVNHWISDPLSSVDNATIANQADLLQARAQACADQWGRPVSTLAVDDYAVGDLFSVVDALNGVD